MKYILIILLFLSLGAKAQVDVYLSTSVPYNFTTVNPMLGVNMMFMSKTYMYESSIISALDNHNANLLQQKVGVHVNNWSVLAGGSYHVYPNGIGNEWAFVGEMRYTRYLFRRFWGLTLQHDGNLVLFGFEIGGKF